MFCVIGAFSLLLVRLFFLQVIEGEEYRRLSENNCIRLQSIKAPRGLIFDAKQRLLVDNRPAFNLTIVPKDARPVEKTIGRLSAYTQIPEEAFYKKLKGSRRRGAYKPVVLKPDISRDLLAVVEAHKFDLPGIAIEILPKRHYLYRYAAHLIGYLGEISAAELKSGQYPESQGGDSVGKFGIEKSGEGELRGKSGGRQVEVNARGQVVRVLKTVDAVPGCNIHMTIDHRLQVTAESLLAEQVGAVVAADAETGNILAMANSPTFDQNAFVTGMSHKDWNTLITDPYRPMENKVIQGEYPPASTYKIVTAIAGLEEGVIDENTTFFCPGYYRYGDRTFRCWRRSGHGSVNVAGALTVSCDVFFYQVGQRLGVDRLARYARACGLGKRTGIRLGHEGDGLIPTAAWKKKRVGVPWQRGETLSIAIGQGYNLATPLQMVMLTAAVANGGTLYRPHIIKKIVSAGGDIVLEAKPEAIGRLPASPETLRIVKKGLWQVVNGSRGTARLAKVDGVRISGKTGTAQVVSRKKNEDKQRKNVSRHLKPHAWFVAYGEKNGEQIAVTVIVEHGEHGSSAAAPIARDLIRAYFMADEEEHHAE
ncbi:penicillin-binding protein 2 [Desulfonema ishimotonii]|uniref:Penicillin-binding protein 2 n=2 Tax=Desulfonema ishimotonii TaxID=45657 RepID=A0A401G4D3_9BACT|nr:penicillin-binding protein 2 [Desulfonema ishimotonii]